MGKGDDITQALYGGDGFFSTLRMTVWKCWIPAFAGMTFFKKGLRPLSLRTPFLENEKIFQG
jgi:hypothetical protein